MRELKKIILQSIKIISKEGLGSFLNHVKIKIARHEFRVLTPVFLSEKDEVDLKKIVEEGKKNRLKINQINKIELDNDEIIVSDNVDFMRDDLEEPSEITICTIISKNYLAHARTLTKQFLNSSIGLEKSKLF